MEIIEKMTEIYCRVLKLDSIILVPETTAKDIEGWDSLANIQIILEIEKHYGIKFQLHEIQKLLNVGDMLDLIEKKMG